MSAFDEAPESLLKKRKKSGGKAKPKEKPLVETSTVDILTQTKTRLDKAYGKLFETANLLETEKNRVVARAIEKEVAARKESETKGEVDAQAPREMSLWAFMERRMARRPDEKDAKFLKRTGPLKEAFKDFICETLLGEEKRGRVRKWIRQGGLDTLFLFEEIGGQMSSDGTISLDGADKWDGLLKLIFGKAILSAILATPDMKLAVAKICTAAMDNDERIDNYATKLLTLLSADLLFGPPPEPKPKKTPINVDDDDVSISGDDGDDDDESDDDDDDDDDESDDDESDDGDESSGSGSDYKKAKKSTKENGHDEKKD